MERLKLATEQPGLSESTVSQLGGHFLHQSIISSSKPEHATVTRFMQRTTHDIRRVVCVIHVVRFLAFQKWGHQNPERNLDYPNSFELQV